MTGNGVGKRLRDARLQELDDPRQQGKVEYPLVSLMKALIVCLCMGKKGLRDVEEATARMSKEILP